MSRRFGQVPLNIWHNPAFKGLPDEARLAVMYFWCGPHSTSAGIGVVADGYACVDLGWDMDRWLAARKAVEAAGLIERDDTTGTVLVIGHLKANRPANVRHRAAIISQIASIECDRLRERAEAEFVEAEKTSVQKPSQPVNGVSPQPNGLSNRAGFRDAR